ncbi:hypothetical protein ANCCAN_15137 [Ancylostoma caninum]|uniref:HAT C-terminal dimerisation domain-containing protein n=1 Tax=Ancylostoma caninum TaxID=29170 RepID=A0A368G7D3_ANCCA|nr:hypothetical protein ANCCAN_15137 [Ancylostoma caninum]
MMRESVALRFPHGLRICVQTIPPYVSTKQCCLILESYPWTTKSNRCVLVIPSSNADPERTFSTANLTAGERNSLATTTINTMMHVQNNGPSLLTVAPHKLAYQWIHPLEGLDLPSGIHSNLGSTANIMSAIHKALFEGILLGQLNDADMLDEVMGTQVDISQLLNIFSKHALRAMPLRSKRDTEKLRNDLLDGESAKASIFSIVAVS